MNAKEWNDRERARREAVKRLQLALQLQRTGWVHRQTVERIRTETRGGMWAVVGEVKR